MSVREHVEDYVEQRPFLQEALAQDIVNFSALARNMKPEIDGGVEAIKVALRRHREDLQEERGRRREVAGKVMKGTSIRLRSGVKVQKTEESVDCIVGARTGNGYTAVVETGADSHGEEITEQVLISLVSPEDLEDTPGVIAYLSNLLAGKDINITELISCREDTHIVLDMEDSTEAFELLSEKLSQNPT